MEHKEDLIKESASIIEEIEAQLNQILAKKRQEIESELEEKIEEDRKKAKDKMEKVEFELSEERESLRGYRAALSEFDADKRAIKEQIQQHLAQAAEYQPQIEALAAKTMDELKKVMELNDRLEELNMEVVSQIESIKKGMKEKITSVPIPEPQPSAPTEPEDIDDVQSSLDHELEKLKKIKELLGKDSVVRQELDDIDTNPEPAVVEIPESPKPEEEVAVREEVVPEMPYQAPEPEREPEPEFEPEPEPMPEVDVMPEPEIPADMVQPGQMIPDTDLEATLEKYRKSIDAEKGIKLTYFENNKNKVLDVQDIFNAIEKDVEEGQKLYEKLDKTQSPKEQFFTKQEIIWHQETLREFLLTALKVCEKENTMLPQSTADVLNSGVLKNVLDKVSQENWSNKDYFSSFLRFFSDLKSSYQEKTTPHSNHLRSLLKELGI